MGKGGEQMEDLIALDTTWASWDFQPSSWSPGTLLVNCFDDVRSPFVAYAAPGVSLCGETGPDTARWRRGIWASSDAFLLKSQPEQMGTLELDSVCFEIPDDFAGWALEATAAHVERLRAIAALRPEGHAQGQLADVLHAEMEMSYPGALERINDDFAEELCSEAPRRSRRAPSGIRALIGSLDHRQLLDLGVQASVLLVAYVVYRFLREPWAPSGVKVDPTQALQMPVGDFVMWLYGLGHVVLPVAFLAWVYFRRQVAFTLVRNTLVVAGALAVAAYLLYSPNRVYAEGPAQSVPSSALATMPALHLVVAIGLAGFGVVLTRSLLARACWVLYPLLVGGVLIVSGSRLPGLTIGFATAILALSLVVVWRASAYLPALDSFFRVRGATPVRDSQR